MSLWSGLIAIGRRRAGAARFRATKGAGYRRFEHQQMDSFLLLRVALEGSEEALPFLRSLFTMFRWYEVKQPELIRKNQHLGNNPAEHIWLCLSTF